MSKSTGLPSWIAPLLLAAVPLVGPGCGEDDPDFDPAADAAPAAPTYWQDVKPIVDAKCGGCHVEGGIAPFALGTYAETSDLHQSIRVAVESRHMPPWLAADDCTEYVGDRSLSAAQIKTLADWSAAGAPEGDPASPAAPLDVGAQPSLSRKDVTLQVAAPYLMKTEPDDYHCFVLDWDQSTVKYITGFAAEPGNAQVVHHVIAFYAPPDRVADVMAWDASEAGPGYTCFGGPTGGNDPGAGGASRLRWLGAWAPGSLGTDFPAGSGLKIEPGSKIVMQVHYNSGTAGPQPDQTSISFRLDDSVAKEAFIQPWTNPQWVQGKMEIPAGEADVMHTWLQDLTLLYGAEPLMVHSVAYHQHQLGTSGRVEIRRADGSTDCLVDIPRWDFHWQNTYGFVTPKPFAAGDKIYLECHWDNSAPGAVTSNWGEGTSDEMCLTAFYVTYAE